MYVYRMVPILLCRLSYICIAIYFPKGMSGIWIFDKIDLNRKLFSLQWKRVGENRDQKHMF